MQSPSLLVVGADLSAGRKPVTLAALDDDLNIILLDKFDLADAVSYLLEYRMVCLAFGTSSTRQRQKSFGDFRGQLTKAGFRSTLKKENMKRAFEINAQDCYREWLGQEPVARRTLEGRLQRALVLYDQGLRIEDPMDIFEEITRYKLIRGIFRLENVYSSKELDALAASYLAWISLNRPEQIVANGEFVLPVRE